MSASFSPLRLNSMNAFLTVVWSGWRGAAVDVFAAMDSLLKENEWPLPRLVLALLVTLGCWIAYVPIHEILHAFGCMVSGGEVDELLIQPLYGGRLLERALPFVRAGGEYAGRLTQFETRGSDLIYLSTDLAPFLLTMFGAIPLLRTARRRHSVTLFGPGTVLAVAPFVSLPGDLYEVGSILVSSGLRALFQGLRVEAVLALRHDDLSVLLSEFSVRFPDNRLMWITAVAASILTGWVVGNLILLLSRVLADRTM